MNTPFNSFYMFQTAVPYKHNVFTLKRHWENQYINFNHAHHIEATCFMAVCNKRCHLSSIYYSILIFGPINLMHNPFGAYFAANHLLGGGKCGCIYQYIVLNKTEWINFSNFIHALTLYNIMRNWFKDIMKCRASKIANGLLPPCLFHEYFLNDIHYNQNATTPHSPEHARWYSGAPFITVKWVHTL